jgi:hypothetical protein
MSTARVGAVVVGTLLTAAAVSGWAVALREREKGRQAIADLQARVDHFTIFDDATGLLNRKGADIIGAHVVNIARRDSDAVSCCLIQVLPAPGLRAITVDDVITVAEACEGMFRSGDSVARVAHDLVQVVGKGPGLSPTTVESRMAAGMLTIAPPDTPVPQIIAGVGVLHPWDEGHLSELEQRALDDLGIRMAAHGLASSSAVWL